MKKIVLIGASGTIGQAIEAEFTKDCDIIRVGSQSGDYQIDLADAKQITELYQTINAQGEIDAVICAAARGVIFAPIEKMNQSDYITSMQSKLLGQIEVVTQGIKHLKDDVSFTLTTGILNADPIAQGTAAAMVNGAVEGFATAAAIDMPGRQRINVVSPALLEESLDKYGALFPGHTTVSGKTVALAYRKSVFGRINGKVLKVGW